MPQFYTASRIMKQILLGSLAILFLNSSAEADLLRPTPTPWIDGIVNAANGEVRLSENDSTTSLQIKRRFDREGWHFNHKLLLPEEAKKKHSPTRNHGQFKYRFNSKNLLQSIEKVTPKCKRLTHQIQVDYLSESPLEMLLTDEEGQWMRYSFAAAEHPRLLKQVSYSSKPLKRYSYAPKEEEKPPLLTEIAEDTGDFWRIEYTSEENPKVHALVMPDPMSREPQTGYRLTYEDGATTVIDAVGNKKRYCFDEGKKLTAIEEYHEDSLYRSQSFHWDGKGRLLSASLEDNEGRIALLWGYAYDLQGNCIAEMLYGNLSGDCEIPIELDGFGKPIENGVESYTLYSSYSQDNAHRLLRQTTKEGWEKRYQYDPVVNKVSACFTSFDNTIKLRKFFIYDEEGNLLRMIEDDGSSEDPHCLDDVTEKHSVDFTPCDVPAAFGAPQLIEEKAYDHASGKEVVLKRILNSYSSSGHIFQQDLFDAEDKLVQTVYYRYDAMGRWIRKEDAHGNVEERDFDHAGNLISYRNTKEQSETFSQFGLRKTLLSNEMRDAHGNPKLSLYQYDALGRMTSETDFFGNETRYVYDAFGRCIETLHPLIEGLEGALVHPTIRRSYTLTDQVAEETDPNGYMTRTRYNVRGHPIEILYPDGTREKMSYALNGNLTRKETRTGSIIHYTYDWQNRLTHTEIQSKDSDEISRSSLTYNSFHQLSSRDPDGCITTHHYDFAGREIAIIQRKDNESTTLEKTYDAEGRIASMIYHFAEEPEAFYTESYIRDDEGNIIATHTHDSQGNLLLINTSHSQENLAHPLVNYGYTNSLGQRTLQLISTAEAGTTITTLDPQGKIVSLKQEDPFGVPIAEQSMHYDPAGNKILEIHLAYVDGEVTSQKEVRWEYGPLGRIQAIHESDLQGEMTTRYFYDDNGQLCRVENPDGSQLHYLYNSLGQLEEFRDSEQHFSYIYRYDGKDRCVSCEDQITGTTTTRTYGLQDKPIRESLSNGLSLSYQYDSLGRLILTTLPDQSAIRYTYQGPLLKSVQRVDSEGEFRYAHEYSAYNTQGQLLTSQLPGEAGNTQFTYDHSGRCVALHSPYLYQKDSYTPQVLLESTLLSNADTITEMKFGYDAREQLTSYEENGETVSLQYDSLFRRLEQNEETCASVSYDPNGNVCAYQSLGLSYDPFHRLKECTDEQMRICYLYDGFHRRIGAETFEKDPITGAWEKAQSLRFLYQQDCDIGALDSAGNIVQLRLIGLGRAGDIGASVAIELNGQPYIPIHDLQGSIRALIDPSSGEVVERYAFSPFGEGGSSELGNPWRYADKRCDPFTECIHFGYRDYAPALGQWLTPDPLGYTDGPNRYAFNLNNPLKYCDPEGLSVIGDFFAGASSIFSKAIREIRSVWHHFEERHAYFNYIDANLQSVGHQFLGQHFFLLAGYYLDPPEIGIYGNGEKNPKVRITMINGILNTKPLCMDTLASMSNAHAGTNIHYIFRPTEGWTWDMIKAAMVKLGYVSPQARELARTWRRMIHDMGGIDHGGKIVHYAHSIGGADTYAAKTLMTPEELNMIRVITIGAACLIPEGGFESVQNYVSRRDGVPLVDTARYLRALFSKEANIHFIGSHLGFPFIEHPLSTEAYMTLISELGESFIREFLSGD